MKKNNDVGFLIQSVLCAIAVIFYISSIFDDLFINIAQIVFSLALFAFAYNNHKVFKRKYFTIIYIIFGVILLVGALISVFK